MLEKADAEPVMGTDGGCNDRPTAKAGRLPAGGLSLDSPQLSKPQRGMYYSPPGGTYVSDGASQSGRV